MAQPKSANLPGVRVTPAVRASVESVLLEGETLGQFIEKAVLEATGWRQQQAAFVTRGEAAIEHWKQQGGGHTVDEMLGDLHGRLSEAKKRHAARRSA